MDHVVLWSVASRSSFGHGLHVLVRRCQMDSYGAELSVNATVLAASKELRQRTFVDLADLHRPSAESAFADRDGEA